MFKSKRRKKTEEIDANNAKLLSQFEIGEVVLYLGREVTITGKERFKVEITDIGVAQYLTPRISVQYWDNNGVLHEAVIKNDEIGLINV